MWGLTMGAPQCSMPESVKSQAGTQQGGICSSAGASLQDLICTQLAQLHAGLHRSPAAQQKTVMVMHNDDVIFVQQPQPSGPLCQGCIGVHWCAALAKRSQRLQLLYMPQQCLIPEP